MGGATRPEFDPLRRQAEAGGGPAPAPSSDSDELTALTSDFERAVLDALQGGREANVLALVDTLHVAEKADLIEHLPPEWRIGLLRILRHKFDPAILVELDETVRREVADAIGVAGLARAIAWLESDDALHLLETLDEPTQRGVLHAIPAALRAHMEEGLSYPEDSAGRLMQRDLVAVPAFWSVGEVIDFMRETDDLPEDFYDLFVVDPRHRPIGKIALSRLLRAKRLVVVGDIMEAGIVTVPATADQEDVAMLFRDQDLVSAPVVDGAGRLIGAITIDDIVDVIDEEAEEDLMRLAGVHEVDLYRAAIDTTRSRFAWLLVNLVTAVVASGVIALFDATIEQIVALAVLMPIVASMGGNAGTQTLAVAVRSLAMKDLTSANALRVMGKELLVGAFNGVLFAALAGAVAWIWFGELALGLVIAAAMVINLIVAG
ncbi:MAG: magnesium transporter, partial [Alphaproteobacteria bacterium]|nr:magnesium transporter [Alphaproteobacteria bacterium]